MAKFVLFCDLNEVCEFVVYASITWNYPYIFDYRVREGLLQVNISTKQLKTMFVYIK